MLLEFFCLSAQRRLRDVQSLRSGPHTFVLDDGEKILEMAEFGVVVHFIPPVWMNFERSLRLLKGWMWKDLFLCPLHLVFRTKLHYKRHPLRQSLTPGKHRSMPKRYWTALEHAFIIASKNAYGSPEVPNCSLTRVTIDACSIKVHRNPHWNAN